MFVEFVFETSLSLAYLTNQIQERVTTYVQRMLKDGYIDEKTRGVATCTQIRNCVPENNNKKINK